MGPNSPSDQDLHGTHCRAYLSSCANAIARKSIIARIPNGSTSIDCCFLLEFYETGRTRRLRSDVKCLFKITRGRARDSYYFITFEVISQMNCEMIRNFETEWNFVHFLYAQYGR